MTGPSQQQLYYAAVRAESERDQLFLDFVKDGMTCDHLKKLIDRFPQRWQKYANWLPKLPEGEWVR